MAVQYKDYYQTLGVSKTATQDEIRTAFRKLARVHHPDVAKDKKAAESKFKEINEAYEVLGDPEKRQKYDTLGADWARGGAAQSWPGGAGRRGAGGASFGGTGFSDFFEQFFSGGGHRSRGPGRGFTGFGGEDEEEPRGEDMEADLLVSIEEALRGARKKISFRRGGASMPETYEVRVPKGVREGQRIRLAGQGARGGSGAQAGDLLLRVRFEQHPHYRVEGSDLIYELDVPAWKAVLGGDSEVPTPEGSVRLKIPAGSQPGRRLRFKGRGLPGASGVPGDFYVVLQVSLPETLSAHQRALWEELSRS